MNNRLKLGAVLIAVIFLAEPNAGVRAKPPVRPLEAAVLPEELGGFRLIGPPKRQKETAVKTANQLRFTTEGHYVFADGAEVHVSLERWETDSAAYASFTNLRRVRGTGSDSQVVGTSSATNERGVIFFKGTASITVLSPAENQRHRALEFARLFAATLDDGEGDVPVLIKHLPNWAVAQQQALYAVNSEALKLAVSNQPILNELSFDGGTEAVTANYGQSQLVIVEFTTPQFSVDNDQRIWTKISELKSRGEPVPTAYRRVGNYSVFVFGAPDEKTANGLIDQVKYEQVVQWLGDDPYLHERMQRYFAETSAGVLVAVLKSSGLSLLFCLASGAFIGALLFRHRRAQRAAVFSDAGGSVRLNLDDLTSPSESRLLKGHASGDSPNP